MQDAGSKVKQINFKKGKKVEVQGTHWKWENDNVIAIHKRIHR